MSLVPNNIIYGDYWNDEYFLVEKLHNHYVIVHLDYFHYENAIIFTVGHEDTDWSDEMLLEKAKSIVDFLNKK